MNPNAAEFIPGKEWQPVMFDAPPPSSNINGEITKSNDSNAPILSEVNLQETSHFVSKRDGKQEEASSKQWADK